jgi:hypothetical protein
MTSTQKKTVWFPKDFLLAIVMYIPLCAIAGLGWGLAMALSMGGGLIEWLFAGLLWGASFWFFFSIYLAIVYREISTNVPLPEGTTLPELLGKAVKRLRYTVEQPSSTTFICKPKHIIARFFEFNRLHVHLLDGSLALVGPAAVVNKVRKQLRADLPKVAGSAASEV